MFQHYLKYFTGTYLPGTNMWSLPIVRKYNMHANVLANLKITIDMWYLLIVLDI
jgi:hypothetical protein